MSDAVRWRRGSRVRSQDEVTVVQALFVHGLGRSPLSGGRMLRQLRRAGIRTSSIFYVAALERFDSIRDRVAAKIMAMAAEGEYFLIGHSLGGVLIRAALATLPPGTRPPERVFLLGSPVRPSRLASYFIRYWLFRVATRDCGHLLSSAERMEQVSPSRVPTTSIIGTKGIYGRYSPFGNEPNDSVVSESEISADWITEAIRLPILHTWMPANRRVAELVMERIRTSSLPGGHITEK